MEKDINRSQIAALKAYPRTNNAGLDFRKVNRADYQKGYEQAEKDLAPAFEFPFDVPDNDGFIVFTPMDNQTIRRKLKLKKGERVIVSIRKEYEKE